MPRYMKIQLDDILKRLLQAFVWNEGLNRIRVRPFWKIPAGSSRAAGPRYCANDVDMMQISWAPLSTFEYQDDSAG